MTSASASARPVPTITLLPVLVAVDAGGSRAALREAAVRAVRSGVAVHVLHVASAVDPAAHRAENEEILRTAVAEAGALVGGAVHVTSELAYGDAVGRIVASAHTCGVTVVQRGDVPDRRRTPDPEICVQVAARVPGAVVSVPWSWEVRSGPGTVAVGVPDAGEASGGLIALAAESAVDSGATLRVVHAVRPETTDAEVQDICDLLEALLENAVGAGRPAATQVDVRRGRAGVVLHEVADRSELLVLGRHLPESVAGIRLGSVARSLVSRGSCPMLLAPAPAPVLVSA